MEHFFQAFTQASQKLWTRSCSLAANAPLWLGQVFRYVCSFPPLSTWQVSSSWLTPGCDPRTRRSCGIIHHPAVRSVASVLSCCSLLVAGGLCSHLLQGHMGCFGWKWGNLRLQMPCGTGGGGNSAGQVGRGGLRRDIWASFCITQMAHPSWALEYA